MAARDLTRPDRVIIVMTDQHRADLSAREGFGIDCTPTMDALAGAGRWFDRAYTSAPVCTPARTSMLTGRFPSAHGVRENAGPARPRCTQDLFEVARAAGWRTALIGKNHTHLTAEDVDHWVEYGHHGRIPAVAATGAAAELDQWLRAHPGTTTTPTPFPPELQLPARLVDHTIEWLDGCGTDPSLTWLSIPEPHVPYQVPEPYFSEYPEDRVPEPATSTIPDGVPFAWQHTADLARRSGEAERDILLRARASYVGMLQLVDDQLSRLVTRLRDTGEQDRTLIVLVADHGDFVGEYGLMRKGPGLPEVLTRIPFAFSGAGIPRDPSASRVAAHVSIVDLFPTLCDVLGWEVPPGVQGRSLLPLMRGEPVPEPEFASVYAEQGVGGLAYRREDVPSGPGIAPPGVRTLPSGRESADTLNDVSQGGSVRMVRSGRWKLTLDQDGQTRLHDLERDPYETVDLAPDPSHQEHLTRMALLLSAWLLRVADPLPVPEGGYRRRTDPHGYQWTMPPGSAVPPGTGSPGA